MATTTRTVTEACESAREASLVLARTSSATKDAALARLAALLRERTDDVLAATPPAFVITAEFDPLRDEGEAYGARLQSLGVATKVRRYDGMIHAFYVMKGVTPVATEAIDDSTDFLRRTFA